MYLQSQKSFLFSVLSQGEERLLLLFLFYQQGSKAQSVLRTWFCHCAISGTSAHEHMCVFHQCQDLHSVSVTSFVRSKCAQGERASSLVKNLSRTFINHSNFWLKMFPFTQFLAPNTGPSGIIINSVELFNSKQCFF